MLPDHEIIDILLREIVKLDKLKMNFVKDQEFTTADKLRTSVSQLRRIVRSIEIKLNNDNTQTK